MKQELTSHQEKQSNQVNRLTYIVYLILVTYLFVIGDIEWAITNLCISLLFDPFDAGVKWPDRPFYQKIWLIAHLTLTLAGFLYLVLV